MGVWGRQWPLEFPSEGVFHFGRLPFWSSSILVFFHFGRHCLFFEKGVKCSKSKNICYKFMEKYPEGDFQKLSDQLVGALTSEKPKSRENCTNCARKGHLGYNCWG